MVGEGESVAAHYTFRGTHRGEFAGVAPTNRRIEVPGILMARFAEGKIEEAWSGFDSADLLKQLAVGPTAQGPNGSKGDKMSEVTPELVRKAYEALATGNRQAVAQYWADDMVWLVPGHNQLSGWKIGLDEFLAFMKRVGELSENSFQMDSISVMTNDEYSTDVTRNTGHRANNPNKILDIDVAHVLRWRNGKVIAGKGGIMGDGTTQYDQFWSPV